ncbi:MAG: HepT-like ribonuclease domain-containing protein [Longimicrobiaceae bacterium]
MNVQVPAGQAGWSMRPEARDPAHLWDMLQASRRILRYAEGTSLEDVRGNEVLADAIIHRLTVLGRAAARISPSLQERDTDVPWERIGELHSLALHPASGALVDFAWKTATEDIPRLVPRLEALLPPGFEGDSGAFETTSSEFGNP